MAITLDITGVLQAAAFWVSNKGGSNGWKLFFYFYIMLTVLSVFLGNDPVILSGTAFLVYYTKVMEVSAVFSKLYPSECRQVESTILAHVRVCSGEYGQHGSLCWEPDKCRNM